MRLLLAGILTLIPLVAHAKSLDDPGDSDLALPAITNLSGCDGSSSLFVDLGLSCNCWLERYV
jgi:hypothetical protein